MVTVTIKQMVTVTIFLSLALAAPVALAQLTLYTSNAAPTIHALAADFEKRHGVHIDVWRASSVKVLQRLLAEKKAGRWEFDVVSISAPELEALYREGLLQELDSAAQRALLEGTLPAHRGWAPQFINVFVQAYNKNAISQNELPRRWADLADARWKGRLGVEANASEWYCTVLRTLGEEQGAELFRRIAASNGLSVRQGNSVLANMVVSGEVPLALAIYSHMIEGAKAQGAPVDWFALEPLVARVNGVGVSRRPPHPQAARLFYEYLLTDAQPLMVKLYYVSPRQDVPSSLRGAKLVFAEARVDARCDNAYAALLKGKGE
jgi:iron(III) transport system substrate-binding protein